MDVIWSAIHFNPFSFKISTYILKSKCVVFLSRHGQKSDVGI
ncbi:hypothetical protein [Escherichia coli ISC41]|nr:hypothetical protein [Escherichia coli ISC41]